jgi:hypothetical protein
MPEKRLQKVRDAYKKGGHYFPCERYNDHLIGRSDDKCIFCGKAASELLIGRTAPLEYTNGEQT